MIAQSSTSALFSVEVLDKDGWPYSKTLLLNTSKVLFFVADSSYPTTRTVFHYEYCPDSQEKPVKFTANVSVAEFGKRVNEAGNVRFPWIDIIEDHFKPVNSGNGERRRLCVDRIIYGYDIDTTSCFIWFAYGSFSKKRYKTSHLIADLQRSGSASASLSAS